MKWLLIIFFVQPTHDGLMSSYRGWVHSWHETAGLCRDAQEIAPLKTGEQSQCQYEVRPNVTVLEKRAPGAESSRELYPLPQDRDPVKP